MVLQAALTYAHLFGFLETNSQYSHCKGISFDATTSALVSFIARTNRVAKPNIIMCHLNAEKNNVLKTVEKLFPSAISSAETLQHVAKTLERHGFTDDNTLFAQSVCPDEINHEKGDITELLSTHLGEVFHMGGLGGIPFTGKTGFAAFSHHVPKDGHCFVLMAPHVGLTADAQVGKYSRLGQSGSAGTACGAAVAALCHCKTPGNEMPSLLENPNDYQMTYIIHQINQRKAKILQRKTEPEQQAELAKQMWCIAKEMLDEIVSTNFGGNESKLVILTGIQINMPEPFDDYFQPLSFVCHNKQGNTINLLEETFYKSKGDATFDTESVFA